MAPPLVMDNFGLTRDEADQFVGIMFGVAGGLSVVFFAFAKARCCCCHCRRSRNAADRMAAMADRARMQRVLARYGERRTLLFGLVLLLAGFVLFLPWGPPAQTQCKLAWCASTPALPLPQAIAGAVLVSCGYPAVSLVLYILYAQMVGPGVQAVMMGFLTAAGSLARMTGPVFATNVYAAYGPRWIFAPVAAGLLLTLIIALCVYRRIVPHPAYRDL